MIDPLVAVILLFFCSCQCFLGVFAQCCRKRCLLLLFNHPLLFHLCSLTFEILRQCEHMTKWNDRWWMWVVRGSALVRILKILLRADILSFCSVLYILHIFLRVSHTVSTLKHLFVITSSFLNSADATSFFVAFDSNAQTAPDCWILSFWPALSISLTPFSHKYSLTQTDTQMRIAPMGLNDSITL